MKIFIAALAAAFLATHAASAEEPKPQTTSEAAVKTLTGADKKPRRKKTAMCAECGKPEAECECKGHKEGQDEKHESEGGERH